jgi:acetolactate synthase-1/2/3 large subunit
MRASDALVKFLIDEYGVRVVFTVTGGGAMYLNDAFGKNPGLQYIALHHEQSVSMAAEGFSRASNGLSVAQVTTGPGGTNAITGCVGAWIDSEPILFISGQVESFSLAKNGTRQSGVQEVDIVDYVRPYTKYAVRVDDPRKLLSEVDRAIKTSLSGRRGPVWIDIPLDIQNAQIDYVWDRHQIPSVHERSARIIKRKALKVWNRLLGARKPVLCVGNGARGAIPAILEISNALNIPLITGWNGKDCIPSENQNLIGSAGQFGDRPSNILLREADLVLGIGYRFSVPQVGYDPSFYAPNAEVISVDIDPEEAKKCGFFIDQFIESDSQSFSQAFVGLLRDNHAAVVNEERAKWLDWARWLRDFPFEPELRDATNINSFDFTRLLSKHLAKDARIVTDMGTSFTCTHQYLPIYGEQRLLTSSGLAAMGFGLPGAIGVSLEHPDKPTVLITGDGGLMFNLQELQSVATLDLNLKIIIYENQGYLTMKHMQKARFNNLVGADPSTKVDCPNFLAISNAFGLESIEISAYPEINSGLEWLLSREVKGARVLVVHLNPWQELVPRVQTRSDKSGKLYPSVLHEMYPYLTTEIEEKLSDEWTMRFGRA